MGKLCRLWFVLLLATGLRLPGATSVENQAFEAPARSFQAAVWDRAEAEFANFVQKFPSSTRVPEAILFQAQARLEQSNYAGGIELLSSRLATAGTLADEYHFWLGEAY